MRVRDDSVRGSPQFLVDGALDLFLSTDVGRLVEFRAPWLSRAENMITATGKDQMI